jgi:hypothetical protein
MNDKPTCWIVFPVYDTPQKAIEKIDHTELAGRFSDAVTDKHGAASWGNASVLSYDPLARGPRS